MKRVVPVSSEWVMSLTHCHSYYSHEIEHFQTFCLFYYEYDKWTAICWNVIGKKILCLPHIFILDHFWSETKPQKIVISRVNKNNNTTLCLLKFSVFMKSFSKESCQTDQTVYGKPQQCTIPPFQTKSQCQTWHVDESVSSHIIRFPTPPNKAAVCSCRCEQSYRQPGLFKRFTPTLSFSARITSVILFLLTP